MNTTNLPTTEGGLNGTAEPVSQLADAAEGQLLAWVVVANLIEDERNGQEPGKRYRGTPVFAPKAKLYLGEVYSGGLETAHFAGRNRTSGRLSNCVINFRLADNFRVQAIYSPSLHSKLNRLGIKFFSDYEGAQKRATFYQMVSDDRRCKPRPESVFQSPEAKPENAHGRPVNRIWRALKNMLQGLPGMRLGA